MDSLPPDGDPTNNVQAEQVEPAHRYLELQIVQEGTREFRLPFIEAEIVLAEAAPKAFSAGSPWLARLQGDQVALIHQQSDERHLLTPGESLVLQDRRVWLVDTRRAPVGSLEGVDPPFTGRVWHLQNQQTWLGRKGKRLNHVELDHSTISRAHCTFSPTPNGRVMLLSESAGSATTVNGDPLEPGETRRLANGDLLGFGSLKFRFASQGSGIEGESLLTLNTLGTFQVKIGGNNLGPAITNHKSQLLLAMLGTRWGEPFSTEMVLDRFWPDGNLRRSRKNLSFTFSQLRDSMGLAESDFATLILRSPTSLQLSPDRLATHDFIEVQRLTQPRKAMTSLAALERLIALHGGRFLPQCYEEWAEVLRNKLELDVRETLLATARYALQGEDMPLLARAAERLLELDPCDQEAAGLMMEGSLKAAQPQDAVRVYESLTEALQREGLEPDTDVMKLYYRASLGV